MCVADGNMKKESGHHNVEESTPQSATDRDRILFAM